MNTSMFGGVSDTSVPTHFRRPLRSSIAALVTIVVLASLSVLASSSVAPVQANYLGVKPYSTFRVGTVDYDAWTYGDILFYSPPGRVSQEMANQWLAWYARTDEILRTLVGDDSIFFSRYRRNVPDLGPMKVIGTPTDSCGAGCGNKALAEGVGIIDNMVAEPDNFDHHWILFYEQARGGTDEFFDLAACWPRENYVLPNLVAALTYYEIGGMNALARGVPGSLVTGLTNWENYPTSYVDLFVEREQRWFGEQYPDQSYIYPIPAGVHLRIALNEGYETLGRVLRNIGQYPDNFVYPSATAAMCDFRAAINDATDSRYDDDMTNKWRLPTNCDTDWLGDSPDTHPGDMRLAPNGLCVDPNFKPLVTALGMLPCSGAAEQQITMRNLDNGNVYFEIGNDKGCFDSGGGDYLIAWACHFEQGSSRSTGASQQEWQIVGNTIVTADGSNRCITAEPKNRWGGGLIGLETCNNSPAQEILGAAPAEPPVTEPLAPVVVSCGRRCDDSGFVCGDGLSCFGNICNCSEGSVCENEVCMTAPTEPPATEPPVTEPRATEPPASVVVPCGGQCDVSGFVCAGGLSCFSNVCSCAAGDVCENEMCVAPPTPPPATPSAQVTQPLIPSAAQCGGSCGDGTPCSRGLRCIENTCVKKVGSGKKCGGCNRCYSRFFCSSTSKRCVRSRKPRRKMPRTRGYFPG